MLTWGQEFWRNGCHVVVAKCQFLLSFCCYYCHSVVSKNPTLLCCEWSCTNDQGSKSRQMPMSQGIVTWCHMYPLYGSEVGSHFLPAPELRRVFVQPIYNANSNFGDPFEFKTDSRSNIASESSDILRRIPSIRAASRSANILVFCFADVFGGIEESFDLESMKSSKHQNALRIGENQ